MFDHDFYSPGVKLGDTPARAVRGDHERCATTTHRARKVRKVRC
jgi:hypothetical protein